MAKDIREDADYGDFVEITAENAHIQLDRARKFFEESMMSLDKMIKDQKILTPEAKDGSMK